MDYLARESADLSVELWNRIDDTVIGTARKQLSCRRFLKVFGPLGPGATTVAVDGVGKEEVLEDGIGRIVGRTQLELPLFYEDFTLLGRDLELAAQTGINPNTAQKAYRLMTEEGYVVTDGNSGSYLRLTPALREKIDEELTRGLVEDFVARAKANRLSYKKVIALVSELWDDEA